MKSGKMQVVSILSMPFAENSYLVFQEGARDAIVIDPGLEPQKIINSARKHNVNIVAILNTHGHADHIGGNHAMKEHWPEAPLMIGVKDAPMLTDSNLNLSAPFGMPIFSPPADRLLYSGDQLELAGMHFLVRDLPGHSPGHVVFIVQNEKTLTVFGGDTLFAGSIGRSDFPGGSLDQLLTGIRQVLFTLPDDTVVFPGHNEPTTVGGERRSNPYLT